MTKIDAINRAINVLCDDWDNDRFVCAAIAAKLQRELTGQNDKTARLAMLTEIRLIENLLSEFRQELKAIYS